ncbi:phage protease [Grimontia kaedaensis]|uniref:Phage protease n=1 Tax=Grimontia kaedaensis TaxID=2872157 RepID=A0ABY4WNC9_9GAMM|nr:phage protease [Grimontia kaedaensis]USH01073.1 phage protease [Grimontia kaedaensis]
MKTETLILTTELSSLAANSAASGASVWAEFIPAGTAITGRDGRSWVNDDPDAIVAAFASNGADLPIDIEHATEIKGKAGEPAPAVGWIKALQAREGGAIWGQVEWNDTGRDLVNQKAYRYLSPVFTFDINSKRILQLYSAGLTNQPNLHLTALNRRTTTDREDTMPLPLAICTALALPPEATDAQAVSAINQLKDDKATALNQAQNPSIDKFVPRADHDAALNRAQDAESALKAVREKALNQQIEETLDKALKAGVITPATVDYHRACCKEEGGLARFEKYAETAPTIGDDSGLDDRARNQTSLTEEDRVACRLLGIEEDAYTAAKETD